MYRTNSRSQTILAVHLGSRNCLRGSPLWLTYHFVPSASLYFLKECAFGEVSHGNDVADSSRLSGSLLALCFIRGRTTMSFSMTPRCTQPRVSSAATIRLRLRKRPLIRTRLNLLLHRPSTLLLCMRMLGRDKHLQVCPQRQRQMISLKTLTPTI